MMSRFFTKGCEFRAAIFDMDGTLVDSMPHHHKAWMAFLQQQKLSISAEEFEQEYHKGTLIEVMERLFPKIKNEKELRSIGDQKEALFRKIYAPHLKPITGLIPFLEKLKHLNIPLGLATMGDQNNIDFTLDGIHISHFFKATTGGDQVKKGKPDPEIFLKTAGKLGISPEQCLAFEDTRSGIQSAQAAGMQVVGVATQFTRDELIQELNCLLAITDFSEISNSIETDR